MEMHRIWTTGRLFCTTFLVVSSVAANGQEAAPRLVSPELLEVDSYVYPKIALLQQSGERLIIDAVLFHHADVSGKGTDRHIHLSKEFQFRIPASQHANRICIDVASGKAGFRKLSLMKLVEPAVNVTARVDYSRELDSDTVIVAYPASLQSDNPQEACISDDDWVFAISRLDDSASSGPTILQFRINTGGADAKVTQVDESGAIFGDASLCERDEDISGLFNRVCSLKIPADIEEVRVQILIARRNAGSARKTVRVSLASKHPNR